MSLYMEDTTTKYYVAKTLEPADSSAHFWRAVACHGFITCGSLLGKLDSGDEAGTLRGIRAGVYMLPHSKGYFLRRRSVPLNETRFSVAGDEPTP